MSSTLSVFSVFCLLQCLPEETFFRIDRPAGHRGLFEYAAGGGGWPERTSGTEPTFGSGGEIQRLLGQSSRWELDKKGPRLVANSTIVKRASPIASLVITADPIHFETKGTFVFVTYQQTQYGDAFGAYGWGIWGTPATY